ncbi:MAG: hypothetical protein R3B54_03635 [Bdellovibrionota bacterium]
MHRLLEEKAGAFLRQEAALLFPTGFDAIAAPARCLPTGTIAFLIDSSSHAYP